MWNKVIISKRLFHIIYTIQIIIKTRNSCNFFIKKQCLIFNEYYPSLFHRYQLLRYNFVKKNTQKNANDRSKEWSQLGRQCGKEWEHDYDVGGLLLPLSALRLLLALSICNKRAVLQPVGVSFNQVNQRNEWNKHIFLTGPPSILF